MWLAVALLAQLILGTSAVFDKVLLRRRFCDPWAYTFWLGVLGLIALALAPFGLTSLPLLQLFLALLAGALFVLAMLLLFLALKRGEASGTLPVIGGLSAVCTFLVSRALLESSISGGEFIGFGLLVLGSLVLFLTNASTDSTGSLQAGLGTGGRKFRFTLLFLMVASAFLFGLSNVLTKIIFDASSFITGFVWIKIGGVLFVLPPLLFASFRRRIFVLEGAFAGFNRFLYFSNRVYAGAGSVLVYVAIFLAHPALVDATQSFKYVVIFFTAWLWLRERFKERMLWGKIAATVLIGLGIIWLAAQR